MNDGNNILLITDDENISDKITKKLVLLRYCDKITVTGTAEYRKALESSDYSIVILHEADDKNKTLKIIKNITEIKKSADIIILTKQKDTELIISAYDCGVADYITADFEAEEIIIRTLNIIKLHQLKKINEHNKKFLARLGAIDDNSFYNYKYLKDAFIDLSEDKGIKNGIYISMDIDKSVKTKGYIEPIPSLYPA